MRITSDWSKTEAGQCAAHSQKFAPKWGGCQVQSWAKGWVEERQLPESKRGCHAKVGSLLSDPAVAAKLKAYLQSNKWAMNPSKLAKFSKNELIPSAAESYLHQII